MRTSNILIALGVAAATCVLWASFNEQRNEPPWPSRMVGVSFSPLRLEHDAAKNRWPTPDEIRSDLALLAGKVRSVRTYGMQGTLSHIPALAQEYGLKVTVGAWITGNPKRDEREIRKLIRVVNENPNVIRVIVGNETLLRKDVSPRLLVAYLDRVRANVKVPVSTAEPWHVWRKYPELVRHADFIAAQVLPWWEGIPIDRAVDFVAERYRDLQKSFPGKKILISEVGWPSNGLERRAQVTVSHDAASLWRQFFAPVATPSPANQATFLRRFLARAEAEGYDYYLMEAFDQPWKSSIEGAVGAYWGIYNADRKLKFALSGPVSAMAQWPALASASVILGLLLFALFVLDGASLNIRGRLFLAFTAQVVSCAAVWGVHTYTGLYLSRLETAVGMVLAGGFVGTSVLLLVEAHEMAEAVWVTGRKRLFGLMDSPESDMPRVSIHVPAYSEPPSMMINTINALARLDYPDYEVVVIDNNTEDPALWQPVRAECERLGTRFRFFHVDRLAGFKAGALNYALKRTAQDAEIVAVIDSDYIVDPQWLKTLVPHFSDREVAIVQAPQDYRQQSDDHFKSMCYAEYRGFFHIGMVTRNERNAIVQHGTMTMIRKSVLEDVGGWAEWCITEDSELGLRIFEKGFKSVYVNRSCGRGILPDRICDYQKQRFRWVYGAVQILRRHALKLFKLSSSRLSTGQCYHFLAGWLPWLADGFNMLWTITALFYSAGMIAAPSYFGPPPAIFVLATMFSFGFRVFKTAYLYHVAIGVPPRETLGAVVAGMGLCHTVGKAVVLGFFTHDRPFVRTPKCQDRPHIARAVAAASDETAVMLGLWVMAFGVAFTQGKCFPAAMLWSVALMIQSIPYLATLVISFSNSAPELLPALESHQPDWLHDKPKSIQYTVAAQQTRSGFKPAGGGYLGEDR